MNSTKSLSTGNLTGVIHLCLCDLVGGWACPMILEWEIFWGTHVFTLPDRVLPRDSLVSAVLVTWRIKIKEFFKLLERVWMEF